MLINFSHDLATILLLSWINFLNCINSRTPLRYRWSKSGNGNLPSKAYTQNFDRVLVIPNVQFTDEGTYTCHVQGRTQTESKDFLLTINGQFVLKRILIDFSQLSFSRKLRKLSNKWYYIWFVLNDFENDTMRRIVKGISCVSLNLQQNLTLYTRWKISLWTKTVTLHGVVKESPVHVHRTCGTRTLDSLPQELMELRYIQMSWRLRTFKSVFMMACTAVKPQIYTDRLYLAPNSKFFVCRYFPITFNSSFLVS